MRKIQWHYNLGYVNLSLVFDNGSFKFKCLPIHAILISYFDDSSNLNINNRNKRSKWSFY
jgi:anaphase-promoting complex subunit 2